MLSFELSEMKTLRKTFLLIALSGFLLLAGLFLYSGVAFMALYYPGAILSKRRAGLKRRTSEWTDCEC